jgi:HSP20 family protein
MLFPSFILDDLLYNDFQSIDNKTKVTKLDNGYNLQIAIPGVASDKVSVELDPVQNQIAVEVLEASDFVGVFKKVYDIPTSIDHNTIETSIDYGVLSIKMARKQESSRKKLL